VIGAFSHRLYIIAVLAPFRSLPSPTMQLPQELFDAIVQNIDDHPALQSCALAGPQLRDPSQRILLQSVTLRGGGWAGNYPRERVILQHSPHIATYITDLTVYISGRPGPQQRIYMKFD
jgi:hypothetical protein